MAITIRVTGDLGGSRVVEGVMDAIVGRTVGRLLTIGERSARSGAPKDTGGGARSIVSQQSGLTGEVSSPLIAVSVMDQGRRPGATMPPPAALVPWVRRHGLGIGASWSVTSRRRLGSRTTQRSQDLEAAFLIARAIGRRGIRGKGFFAQAANDMIRSLPAELQRAAAEIGESWKRAA